MKGEKTISLLIARQLKEEELNVVPGHLLCVERYTTILASETESELEVENNNETNDDNMDERNEPDDFSCVTPW